MKKDVDKEIIDYLKKSRDVVTSDELSNKLNISKKTISRHVKQINAKYTDPIISSQRGQGYKLNYDNYLDLYFSNITENSTKHLRQEYILNQLLLRSPGKLAIDELINTLYVSDGVLNSDINDIATQLKHWHIAVIRQNRMISIEGDEQDIRNALVKTVLHINQSTDIDVLRHGTDCINQRDFDFALKQVEMSQRVLNGNLPYPYNINFFSHIYILLTRIRKYQYVSPKIKTDKQMIGEIKANPEIFSVCKKIVLNIKSYLNNTNEKLNYEAFYLFEYLLSSRLNSVDGMIFRDETLAQSVSLAFIEQVSQKLNFQFPEDIYEDIEKHILAMISRLKMQISLPNALLNDIQLEYPQIFEATKLAAVQIEQKYDLPTISVDECGFISLYFAKYYEKSLNNEKIVNIYVICTTGIGTSQIISTKLKNMNNDINIIGVGSAFDNKYCTSRPFETEYSCAISKCILN
ncbi:BglG family transcription antiterminator [Lactobacillus crispatus]|uniref:BglG family transcription antiterminator n=1 Tax=Lactobacillus crispatus TaxID=47770 RepID=UPI0014758A88|nr:PRD domain-containing protein [Lactobacillus crispatus]MBE5059089.1 PRD domain-containing protein [Lactobacillus crispatus]NME26925.1 PRD domain-containing protein [Lactobacillus crispatus]